MRIPLIMTLITRANIAKRFCETSLLPETQQRLYGLNFALLFSIAAGLIENNREYMWCVCVSIAIASWQMDRRQASNRVK